MEQPLCCYFCGEYSAGETWENFDCCTRCQQMSRYQLVSLERLAQLERALSHLQDSIERLQRPMEWIAREGGILHGND